MQPCSWTAPEEARYAGLSARARFTAALACSVLIHTLITTGIPPGKSGRIVAGAGSFAPITLEVELLELAPALPIAEAVPEPQVRTQLRTALASPTERKRLQAPPRAASVAEASPRSDGVGLTPIPDPTYYGTRQLDVYPVLAGTLSLGEAEGTPAPPGSGRVLLLVLIDAEGRVNEVSVIEAQPPGVFDEHTRAAFQAARFRPALKNGRPVKSRLLVDVDYGENARR